MRLLHTRHPDDVDCVPRAAARSRRGRGASGTVRQFVPLHRLSAHRGCGAPGGRADARLSMETRHIGRPVTRNEDPRLLTGRALFMDDVAMPGLLHAAFLRSPHAHAEIRSIDVAEAAARPGVVAVITADDLGAYWQPGPLLVPPPPVPGLIFHPRCQVPLAKGKVRHVGEPIAMVVAENRYIAEDALGDIAVAYHALRPTGDLEAALAPEAPPVHDD